MNTRRNTYSSRGRVPPRARRGDPSDRRGLLAIVLLVGGMFFFNILFPAVAVLVEGGPSADGGVAYTPLFRRHA